MGKLTPEHELLCDAAAMMAHLDKYSRNEQRALLQRVINHLTTVVEDQAEERDAAALSARMAQFLADNR